LSNDNVDDDDVRNVSVDSDDVLTLLKIIILLMNGIVYIAKCVGDDFIDDNFVDLLFC